MKKIIGLLVMIGLCVGMVGCSENTSLTTSIYTLNETSQEVIILGTEFSCRGVVTSYHYDYEAVIYNLKCDNGQMVYNIQNFMVE